MNNIKPWEKHPECQLTCWRKDGAYFWWYERKEWATSFRQWIGLFVLVFSFCTAVVVALWLAKLVGVYQ